MNIKIKGGDIEVTEAIKNYTEEKICEALNKFNFKEDVLTEIELGKTNNHHSSGEMYKATAKLSGVKKEIFSEVIKDDLYASIDALKDKLEERISEMKDKRKTLKNKIAKKFKELFKRGE